MSSLSSHASDSSKTRQLSPFSSRSVFPSDPTTSSEQWSEISSPCDSAFPSRNSLCIDGDAMSSRDQADLAAFFLDAARAQGVILPADRQQRPSTDPDDQAVSRARTSPLTMPKNFAQVLPGIYRAHYPVPENFTFLRMLGIRTILTLVPEQAPDAHADFMAQAGIQHFQIGIEPNKDPAVTVDPAAMDAALRVMAATENHPILVHCNKGKHRTGCVVACLRKVTGWSLDEVVNEYRHYAGSKARDLDERYIAGFDERPFQALLARKEARPVREPFSESPVVRAVGTSTRLRG